MAKILCVEDETILREDIAEELADAGHEVFQAVDGRDGLQKILEVQPDLVLSDITMPNMDGYQLVKSLRNDHKEFAEMPFIFLSALSDREHLLEGMKSGADDYLIKPIDFELMLVKVEAALRLSRRFVEKKEEEAIKLYMALTRKEDEPEEELENRSEESRARLSPTNLPSLNIMCVGELDSEFRLFENGLKENGHKITLFTNETAYLDVVDKLPIHVAFLWRFDSGQRQNFEKQASSANPQNIIVRLMPRENRKKKVAAQTGPDDLVVCLPIKTLELSGLLSEWISQKIRS